MTKPARQRPGSRMGVRHGRPVVLDNGLPVPQAVYCDYIMRGDWQERVREFVESGVKVFHILEPHGAQGNGHDFFDNAMWVGDGVYPADDHAYEYSLDRQAETILAMQPQARFYIKLGMSPPIRWAQKYPGEIQTDEDGKVYREASWASRRYLRDLAHYVGHFVRFCEGRRWAERIAGYMASPYGEGCSQIVIAGKMFDCSRATDREFRAWVCKRYGTVARLRRAWGDRGITFARVRAPRDRQWLAKRAAGPATVGGRPAAVSSLPTNCQKEAVGLFHWIEPQNAARERDYCLFMRGVFQGWIRTVIRSVKGTLRSLGKSHVLLFDITKQPMFGWQIQSNFDGMGDGQSYPNMLLLSGSWDVGPLLDDDGLDGLWTPADYTARTLGFALECEGLSDSLVLRGKTMMLEDDARTYVGAGIQDQGAFRSPVEVEAGLLRNVALGLSRGFESYWCNVGSSYFHDRRIHKTVRKLARMRDRLAAHPHRETRDAVAFVVDDESCMLEDLTSGYQSLAVIWQRVRGLAHCGVPYRIFLLSDLEKENLARYKTWFFPNLFCVNERVTALLRDKVLRDGNVAIFGPATGITDGRRLSAVPATGLLGVQMELHLRTTVRHVVAQDSGHPITKELPANLVFGDSMPYGPTLTPAERAVERAPRAAPLGHANTCWFIHRTGLFVNEFRRGAAGNGRSGPRGRGDCAVLWSVAMPLPAGLLRACARYAGSNIWCEEDDVIYASDSIAAIHSTKAGRRVLCLPRPCKVSDAVTGLPLGSRKRRRVELFIRPPQTRVFALE